MVKTYCDICGTEAQTKKRRIKTGYTANASVIEKEMDVCEVCNRNLEDLHGRVEIKFVKCKGNFGLKFD